MLLKQIAQFIFKSSVVFWFVLAGLELLMPGFVIYYLNLNLLLAIAVILGFANVVLSKNSDG